MKFKLSCIGPTYKKRLINSYKSMKNKHTIDTIKTIKRNNVRILGLDKGNGCAIIYEAECLDKMNEIINDIDKFNSRR